MTVRIFDFSDFEVEVCLRDGQPPELWSARRLFTDEYLEDSALNMLEPFVQAYYNAVRGYYYKFISRAITHHRNLYFDAQRFNRASTKAYHNERLAELQDKEISFKRMFRGVL